MKKIILLAAMCGIFTACNSSSNTSAESGDTATVDTTTSTNQTAKSTEPSVDTNATKTGASMESDTAKK